MTILKRMARAATIGVMTEAIKRRSGCDHFFCCRSTRARKSPAPTDVCCDGVATRRSGRPIADANALTDRDIPAGPEQAGLQYEANDQYLRRQPADSGNRGLTTRVSRQALAVAQHVTRIGMMFSHDLGQERPFSAARRRGQNDLGLNRSRGSGSERLERARGG
jgi:hypothetical protein